jgi:hypothetical protein
MPDPHEVYGEGSASALGGPQGRVSEGQEGEGEEEGAAISLDDIRMVNAAPRPAQVGDGLLVLRLNGRLLAWVLSGDVGLSQRHGHCRTQPCPGATC